MPGAKGSSRRRREAEFVPLRNIFPMGRNNPGAGTVCLLRTRAPPGAPHFVVPAVGCPAAHRQPRRRMIVTAAVLAFLSLGGLVAWLAYVKGRPVMPWGVYGAFLGPR